MDGKPPSREETEGTLGRFKHTVQKTRLAWGFYGIFDGFEGLLSFLGILGVL
jgi:hypothetical protein